MTLDTTYRRHGAQDARWPVGLILLVICCFLSACAQPKSQVAPDFRGKGARVDSGPYFHPGEHMTWELKYLGMSIGRARLAVGIPGLIDGQPTVGVIAQAETLGVLKLAQDGHDVMFSWLNAKTGVPRYSESELKINDKHIRVVGSRAKTGPMVELFIENFKKRYKRTRRKRLPHSGVHDTLSSLLAIRGWSAKEGESAMMYVLGGARLWQAQLTHKGLERIGVPLGNFEAYRIDGHAVRLGAGNRPDPKRQRTFTLWISNDTDKVLLRFEAKTEYGDLEMEATGHQSSS